MNGVWTDIRFGLFASAAFALASGAHAEGVSEREIDGVDKRFAIASKHFGDGEVQLHTRSETEAGSVHEIYSFNCNTGTYRTDYVGESAPAHFPVAGAQGQAFELAESMEQAAIAAHACEEHGYSSLKVEQ